ncbi:MAG: tape measure protein [Paraprevotella sp.]|nr:tape measure protein [Paraprevotella sp.]
MSNQTINYTINILGNVVETINQINQNTTEMNTNISNTLNVFKSLPAAAVGFESIVNNVKGVSEVLNVITQTGANAELQLINMKTLFGGNAEAAQEMYDRISEYGKVTPYDKAGLIDAQKTMMSFGMSGEQAFNTLKQIGDIAMGDSQKMQSLSLAFAQMYSTSKLTGQDLMQMINAGFNPLNEISKATGKSVGQLNIEHVSSFLHFYFKIYQHLSYLCKEI